MVPQEGRSRNSAHTHLLVGASRLNLRGPMPAPVLPSRVGTDEAIRWEEIGDPKRHHYGTPLLQGARHSFGPRAHMSLLEKL